MQASSIRVSAGREPRKQRPAAHGRSEVRSRDVAFQILDGQLVGRLVYERLTETPDKLYGRDIGSTYQSQGLKLGEAIQSLL